MACYKTQLISAPSFSFMCCLLVYPSMQSLPVWICMSSPHFLQDFHWHTLPSLFLLFSPDACSWLAWMAQGRKKKSHFPLCSDISLASRPGQVWHILLLPFLQKTLDAQKLFGLDPFDPTSLGLGHDHRECSPCPCWTPIDNKKWVNIETLEPRCRHLCWQWDKFWAEYGHIYAFYIYLDMDWCI